MRVHDNDTDMVQKKVPHWKSCCSVGIQVQMVITIEVGDSDELMSALKLSNKAYVAGDIDVIIGFASTKVQSAFGKQLSNVDGCT